MSKLTVVRTVAGLAVLAVEFRIMEKARNFTREKKHVKAWGTVGVGLAVGYSDLLLVDEVCKVYRNKQLEAKQTEIEAPTLIEA